MKPITFYLILLFPILIFTSMTAQELSTYKWKNRVLIITTNTMANQQFQDQMAELQKSTKDLQERKLVVYAVTRDSYALRLSKNDTIIKLNNSKFYKEMHTEDTAFEVILIGLDGGEKLRQTKVLETDKLFAIIDGMPMRRSEIIKNN